MRPSGKKYKRWSVGRSTFIVADFDAVDLLGEIHCDIEGNGSAGGLRYGDLLVSIMRGQLRSKYLTL